MCVHWACHGWLQWFVIICHIIIGGLIGADKERNGAKLVFIAAALTLAIVVGLTIYAFTTKTDFTTMYLIILYSLGEVFYV